MKKMFMKNFMLEKEEITLPSEMISVSIHQLPLIETPEFLELFDEDAR